MAEYDLTSTISKYLDPHIIRPLLSFLGSPNVNLYDETQVLQAELEILQKTRMTQYKSHIYKKVNKTEQTPPEYEKEKEQVLAEANELYNKCSALLAIINNEELLTKLQSEQNFTLAFLAKNHGITEETLENLYHYAKIRYDCGEYAESADLLHYYRLLVDPSDVRKIYKSEWGKLAAKILIPDYNGAQDDINILKDMLDTPERLFEGNVEEQQIQQSQHRSWLIHWSLFVFFNHQNGKNAIIDTFFQEKFLNIIQTECPHILRYLTTAVIVNKKRRGQWVKELVRLIEQEQFAYSDPILKFMESLFVRVDFEGAQAELSKCDTVLKNDFFLAGCRQDFLENARQFVFENYCRIHRVIDIESLAQNLNMDKQNAEKWIVNLIRNARYAAKIDSKTNRVIMQEQHPNVYQQIVEKTEGMTYRTTLLRNNLEKKIANLAAKEKEKKKQ